jgi:hypothetical protein
MKKSLLSGGVDFVQPYEMMSSRNVLSRTIIYLRTLFDSSFSE